MEQLSKMNWPRGGLKHTTTDVNIMTYLVCERWPRLQEVEIREVAVESMALQMLLEAPCRRRSRVWLTVRSQDTAVMELLGSIWMDKQELRVLQLQAAQNPVMHLDVYLVAV